MRPTNNLETILAALSSASKTDKKRQSFEDARLIRRRRPHNKIAEPDGLGASWPGEMPAAVVLSVDDSSAQLRSMVVGL